MPYVKDALYTDKRLVDIYDLLNSDDSDFRFYSEHVGKQKRKVLDLGALERSRSDSPALVTR